MAVGAICSGGVKPGSVGAGKLGIVFQLDQIEMVQNCGRVDNFTVDFEAFTLVSYLTVNLISIINYTATAMKPKKLPLRAKDIQRFRQGPQQRRANLGIACGAMTPPDLG